MSLKTELQTDLKAAMRDGDIVLKILHLHPAPFDQHQPVFGTCANPIFASGLNGTYQGPAQKPAIEKHDGEGNFPLDGLAYQCGAQLSEIPYVCSWRLSNRKR